MNYFTFVLAGTDMRSVKAAIITSKSITTNDISIIVKMLPHLTSLEIIYSKCKHVDLLCPLMLVKKTLTTFSIQCQSFLESYHFPISLLPLLECRRLRSVTINVLQNWWPQVHNVSLLHEMSYKINVLYTKLVGA